VGAWLEALPGRLASQASWAVDVAGFLVGTLVGRPVMDRITAADYPVDGPVPISVPASREPFEVAGELAGAFAERLGVAHGVPVAVGTYDTFVDLAGIGASETGSAAILLGSTLVVGTVRPEPDAPEGLRSSPHVGPGWFVGGWTSAAGRALGWAASLATDADRPRVISEGGAMAPGGSGLLALPYLDGERAPVWDPSARGVLLGLTTTTTLAQVYRGVLDGVVLSTLDLAERLEPLRTSPWIVAGGGVRDAAWTQATADALGEPLQAIDLPDAAAAARAGFVAIGIDVARPAARTVEPDMRHRDRWRALAAVSRGMYEDLADRMHRLGELADHGPPP
jgi:xylulokinase